MDTRQIAYFVQVYQTRNMTRAARSLYISQQGLSIAITRLERELGRKLFDRSASGVQPTPDGEYFYSVAKNITALLEECQEHFSTADPELLPVAVTYGVADWSPVPIQEALMNLNPSFSIRKVMCGAVQVDEFVESGECELGFSLAPVDSDKFCSHILYETRNVLLVLRTHPLAQYKSVNVQQLQGQRIVTPRASYKSTRTFFEVCKRLGVTFSSVSETISPFLSHRLLSINSEFVVLTMALHADSIHDANIVSIEIEGDEFRWQPCLIYRHSKPLSLSARHFKEFVLECFKNTKDARTVPGS